MLQEVREEARHVLYSIGRFWLEFLRGDSFMFGGITVAQATSVLIVLVRLALLHRVRRRDAAPLRANR